MREQKEWGSGGRKLQCVCVWKEKEWGLRVNMHHCSRLIFHQTVGSVQRPATGHYSVPHGGGRGGRGVEVQEICSSRVEEERERVEGRCEAAGKGGGMNVKEFAKRKRVFPLLENEMGDRRKKISGEIERGRGE